MLKVLFISEDLSQSFIDFVVHKFPEEFVDSDKYRESIVDTVLSDFGY